MKDASKTSFQILQENILLPYWGEQNPSESNLFSAIFRDLIITPLKKPIGKRGPSFLLKLMDICLGAFDLGRYFETHQATSVSLRSFLGDLVAMKSGVLQASQDDRREKSLPVAEGKYPPWKLRYPLKNDGWKMYFLLK